MFMTLHAGCIVASDFQVFDEDEMFGDSWDSSSHIEESSAFIHNNDAINNQNNLITTPLQKEPNYEDCLLSAGWNISNELDGNLEAILQDSVPYSVPLITDEDMQEIVDDLAKGNHLAPTLKAPAKSLRYSQRLIQSINTSKNTKFKQTDAQVSAAINKKSLQPKKIIKANAFSLWKINSAQNFKFSDDRNERKKQQGALLRKKQIDAATILREGKLLQYSPEDQEDIKINAARHNRKKMLDKGYAERNKKLVKSIAIQKQTK